MNISVNFDKVFLNKSLKVTKSGKSYYSFSFLKNNNFFQGMLFVSDNVFDNEKLISLINTGIPTKNPDVISLVSDIPISLSFSKFNDSITLFVHLV